MSGQLDVETGPDDEGDWDDYTEEFWCPPHIDVECGRCGQIACTECGLHFSDDHTEEALQCPTLKAM